MDPDTDRKISEHVLRMHRYRNPGEQDGDRKQIFLTVKVLHIKLLGVSLWNFYAKK